MEDAGFKTASNVKYFLLLVFLLQLIDFSAAQFARLSQARAALAAAGANNKIVFAGGLIIDGGAFTQSTVVDIYDSSTGTWNSTSTGAGELSVARAYFAAAAAGNLLVFAGGQNGSSYVATVDTYDTTTGEWRSSSTGAGQLSVARAHHAAAAAGNKIIFAGGYIMCVLAQLE